MSKIIRGVYFVINNANGMVYVGSSGNVNDRLRRHRKLLENGKHHNKSLQADFNYFGSCNFAFVLVEETPHTAIREQYWINQKRSSDPAKGYNIAVAHVQRQ